MYNQRMSDAKPMGGFVFVRQHENIREKNGILMPVNTERPEIVMGSVISVGDGVENINVGDTVLYDPFNHKTFGDPIVHVVPSFDVFAVLDAPSEGKTEISDLMGTILGRRVYVQWLEAKSTLAGGKLVSSVKHSRGHYTGTILGLGMDLYGADLDGIEVGDRVFFQQFSDFKYWYEPGGKRYAIIPHHGVMAVVPNRDTEVVNEAYIGVEA